VTHLGASDVDRIAGLVRRAGLPVVPPPLAFDRWIELMSRDKKADAGAMRFVLLDGLGRATVRGVGEVELRAVLAT
jgi:3-dehydroquinate synthase